MTLAASVNGWPLVSTGRNYTGTLVSEQPWARPGMDNPRIFWVPSISPSSIMFYTGDKFPQWKGNLFIGALVGLAAGYLAAASVNLYYIRFKLRP